MNVGVSGFSLCKASLAGLKGRDFGYGRLSIVCATKTSTAELNRNEIWSSFSEQCLRWADATGTKGREEGFGASYYNLGQYFPGWISDNAGSTEVPGSNISSYLWKFLVHQSTLMLEILQQNV